MIAINDLQKTYDTGSITVEALRGLSFNINKGEFVAIMGASGSGKSTLMNLLGLLDVASAGTYILNQTEVSALEEKDFARIRNKEIGFVFQTFNLLPHLTALHNVELPMMYAGVKLAARRERATLLLERMGLIDRMHHYPNELSGGQNQRVAIARSLANNPAIILADEPTGALDSHTSLEVMDIFQQLNLDGTTIIVVTHEENIAQHAGRILRLSDGLLIMDDIVQEPLDAGQALSSLRKEAGSI
ncbi:MAG: macrolide ABC transporter ATP-binding protein [Firmicutes bacterium HGW-Firmicutes-15]|nr:MAG: macrolide ABC transporter ATP-binding protein [Firmicutes bacterium HGW-Firmicutes-15]